MKSIKFYIGLLVFTICTFIFGAKAQFAVGVNYSPLIPMTDYNSEVKPSAIGVNAKVKYLYDDFLSFAFGTGFYSYTFDKINVDGVHVAAAEDVTLSIIPITFGADFRFTTEKVNPFISLDFGYALTTQSESVYGPEKSRSNFILAPGFGVAYSATETLDLSVAIRNNIVVYEYRDIPDYYQPFQAVGIELGGTYKF